jgi:hypothetical protein
MSQHALLGMTLEEAIRLVVFAHEGVLVVRDLDAVERSDMKKEYGHGVLWAIGVHVKDGRVVKVVGEGRTKEQRQAKTEAL